jgi:hypothetical protein
MTQENRNELVAAINAALTAGDTDLAEDLGAVLAVVVDAASLEAFE